MNPESSSELSDHRAVEGSFTAWTLLVCGLAAGGLLYASGLDFDQTRLALSATMQAAKVIFSIIMLVVATVCFWVFFNRRRYFEALYRQEHFAEHLRDDVLFEMTAARARMGDIEERLRRPKRPDTARLNQMIIEHGGAAVMLLMKQERGLLQWGLWAAKLGKSALEFLNG